MNCNFEEVLKLNIKIENNKFLVEYIFYDYFSRYRYINKCNFEEVLNYKMFIN